jgi:GntR family transcriptional regulator
VRQGTVPLYQQVADRLRRGIIAGEYPIGAQLPSEEELCQEFGVSRITVRAALRQLTDARLLWRRRGKGTFVASPPVEHQLIRLTDFVEDMTAAGLHPASRVLLLHEEAAPDDVAQQLGVGVGTRVVRLDRLRLADGNPIAVDSSFLPLRFGHLLDDSRLAEETIYQQLERRFGIIIHAGTFVVEATDAPEPIASALGIRQGASVLLVHRTARTELGEAVFYQRRFYRADRVRFRLELRRMETSGESQLTEFVPVFVAAPGHGAKGAIAPADFSREEA